MLIYENFFPKVEGTKQCCVVNLSLQDVKRMESYIQLELALLCMQMQMQKSEAMKELQVSYMSHVWSFTRQPYFKVMAMHANPKLEMSTKQSGECCLFSVSALEMSLVSVPHHMKFFSSVVTLDTVKGHGSYRDSLM
jgi:hypothetical protein